ncbi:MAG: hypothetical protein JNJ55_02315, partial [Betaproteobacteria bacterium]|nr:hypothetical protein [Betaproteobacteria bacterium]
MSAAHRRPGASRVATAFLWFACFAAMAVVTGAASVAGFSRMNALNESTRLAAEARGNKLTLVEEIRQAARPPRDGARVREAVEAARAGFSALGVSPEETTLLTDMA